MTSATPAEQSRIRARRSVRGPPRGHHDGDIGAGVAGRRGTGWTAPASSSRSSSFDGATALAGGEGRHAIGPGRRQVGTAAAANHRARRCRRRAAGSSGRARTSSCRPPLARWCAPRRRPARRPTPPSGARPPRRWRPSGRPARRSGSRPARRPDGAGRRARPAGPSRPGPASSGRRTTGRGAAAARSRFVRRGRRRRGPTATRPVTRRPSPIRRPDGGGDGIDVAAVPVDQHHAIGPVGRAHQFDRPRRSAPRYRSTACRGNPDARRWP